MFFTLGIIIGFVLSWFLNDKWDWVKDKCILEVRYVWFN